MTETTPPTETDPVWGTVWEDVVKDATGITQRLMVPTGYVLRSAWSYKPNMSTPAMSGSAIVMVIADHPKYVAPEAPPMTANMLARPSLAQAGGSNLTVSWSPPPVDKEHDAAVSYNMRYGVAPVEVWTDVPDVTSPHTLTGLAPDAAYEVQVQCVNAAGESAWSPPAFLATGGGSSPTPVPASPPTSSPVVTAAPLASATVAPARTGA